MTGLPAVNISALRDEIVRHEPPLGRRRTYWALQQVAVRSAIFYLVAFALPAVLAGTVRRLASGRVMWIELGISLMFAAGLTAWSLHTFRAPLEARVEKSVLSMQRGWAQMTRGHWVLRVIVMGLTMAACIGLTVGTLIAATSAPGELVGGSRVLTVLAFLGLTLAWCIPMAFVIRWLYLWRCHRFIVAA
jgi:hypothetical protein